MHGITVHAHHVFRIYTLDGFVVVAVVVVAADACCF